MFHAYLKRWITGEQGNVVLHRKCYMVIDGL